MALPSDADLLGLDYAYLGEPFCPLGQAGIAVGDPLDWVYIGEPFIALAQAVAQPFIWVAMA